MATSTMSPFSSRGGAYRAPAQAAPNAPSGTFLPGTKVQVGSHRVVIEKYLSEGGFAHVYVARVPREDNKHEIAVLKRVVAPDKDHLANMRTEVETMKKLKGHNKIVRYMDSHASQLQGGGYEVFLLMEYCGGGGLIDFMNTRLQHRLTEPEILKIFGDVAEGVACMHYLKPPLLHRDLKVENVLISKGSSGTPTYKLCDFGSTAPPRPAAKTPEEGRLIEEDVQKHTTMQYRSPEMIDVWRKQPINEKADIWALGVLLYKLCYYTTPFEEVGQMAILNASFRFPNHPSFSDKLKKLIKSMLQEDPKERPNIYQVIQESCKMRGVPVPSNLKDIYSERSQSEARKSEALPSREADVASPPPIGLTKETSKPQVQKIPDIAPMRRGRPTAPSQQSPAVKPSHSHASGDPFAALDSKNYSTRSGAVDELSKRFPSLDEFSITQGKPKPSTSKGDRMMSDRVTNALADEVFASSAPKADVSKSSSTSQLPETKSSPVKPAAKSAAAQRMSQQSPLVHQPTPVRPGVQYTSTGTDPPSPQQPEAKMPAITKRPIWRVPDHSRSSSQPRASDASQIAASALKPGHPPAQRPSLADRSRSQNESFLAARSPTSSRPSLEGHRPSQMDLNDSSFSRAKSAQSQQRPSSVYVSSNLEFLRDQEQSRKRPSMEIRRPSRQPSESAVDNEQAMEETNIDDDLAYMRSNEDNEMKRKSSRKSSGHKKRGSLPSISGAKSVFAGRFGDAFKRFEQDPADQWRPTDQDARSPERRAELETKDYLLSPIAGSEATPSRPATASSLDELEDIPPDMRREMERRQLAEEERRVAQAAEEYRVRASGTVEKPAGGAPTRASTIQQRVQTLLDEGRQSPVPRKTAEGYGAYTDNPNEAQYPSSEKPLPSRRQQDATSSLANPIGGPQYTRARPSNTAAAPQPQASVPSPSASAPPAQQSQSQPPHPQPLQQNLPNRTVARPSAPPKPKQLRTGGQWPPAQQQQQQPQQQGQPLSSPRNLNPPPSQPNSSSNNNNTNPHPSRQNPSTSGSGSALAALLAKDLEGVPDYPPTGVSVSANPTSNHHHHNKYNERSSTYPPGAISGAQDPSASAVDEVADADLEGEFSKRYPSLAGLEMVERGVGTGTGTGGGGGGDGVRVKEV